jgi:hypothetical protein
MCRDLDRDLDPDLACHLFGCPARIFGRMFLDVFLAEVLQNSFPNFLVAHSHLNRYCAPVWGSFTDFHYTEVLDLRRALKHSSAAQACGNAGSQTC